MPRSERSFRAIDGEFTHRSDWNGNSGGDGRARTHGSALLINRCDVAFGPDAVVECEHHGKVRFEHLPVDGPCTSTEASGGPIRKSIHQARHAVLSGRRD